MVLTHSDRLVPKADQAQTARSKMRAFAQTGRRIGQLPAPGVYARSNAADVPAVSGETLGPVEESVPRVLRVRGLERSIGEVDREVAQALALARSDGQGDSPFGAVGPADVGRSGSWGMPGPAAPTGLNQPKPRRSDGAATQEEAK